MIGRAGRRADGDASPRAIIAYQQTRRAKRYRRELLAIRDELDVIADRIDQITNEGNFHD